MLLQESYKTLDLASLLLHCILFILECRPYKLGQSIAKSSIISYSKRAISTYTRRNTFKALMKLGCSITKQVRILNNRR
jgi:hypothetical protein